MQASIVVGLLWAALAFHGDSRWLLGAEPPGPAGEAATTPDRASVDRRLPQALIESLEENLAYGRDWLAAGDFKSLRQTREGLSLLAFPLRGRRAGDDWQQAVRRLEQRLSELDAAARAEDAAAGRQALEATAAAVAALKTIEPGSAAEASAVDGDASGRRPRESMRSLMTLMDGTYADAKRRLIFNDLPGARNRAIVLAELGDMLSNYRSSAPWMTASAEFSAAAREVAEDRDSEAPAIRERLRGVYQKCDDCHDRLR